jgi:hypothetical protein
MAYTKEELERMKTSLNIIDSEQEEPKKDNKKKYELKKFYKQSNSDAYKLEQYVKDMQSALILSGLKERAKLEVTEPSPPEEKWIIYRTIKNFIRENGQIVQVYEFRKNDGKDWTGYLSVLVKSDNMNLTQRLKEQEFVSSYADLAKDDPVVTPEDKNKLWFDKIHRFDNYLLLRDQAQE